MKSSSPEAARADGVMVELAISSGVNLVNPSSFHCAV